MSMLFTRNFMKCWINHLSKRDNYLHKIAQQTVCTRMAVLQSCLTLKQAIVVQTFVKQNPHLGFSLILQLTGMHGSQNFDKLTKTKTISSIISSLDTEGIKKYIRWLFSQVENLDPSYG